MFPQLTKFLTYALNRAHNVAVPAPTRLFCLDARLLTASCCDAIRVVQRVVHLPIVQLPCKDAGWNCRVSHHLSVGSPLQGAQHLEALGGMPMSLHTVEAVSRLAASAKLPRPFLGPFVSRCVAACQSSQVRAVIDARTFARRTSATSSVGVAAAYSISMMQRHVVSDAPHDHGHRP